MTRARIYRFVRYDDLGAYLALGWFWDGGFLHAPHGAYAVDLEWLCDCAPAEPKRLKLAVIENRGYNGRAGGTLASCEPALAERPSVQHERPSCGRRLWAALYISRRTRQSKITLRPSTAAASTW